jgi:hypothetical protein
VHDLRHGFAIRWLRARGDIYRLSRHLGPTSVKTYLGYLTDDEVNPSSRIRGFCGGPRIVYQCVGRKSLHYIRWRERARRR